MGKCIVVDDNNDAHELVKEVLDFSVRVVDLEPARTCGMSQTVQATLPPCKVLSLCALNIRLEN